MAQWKVLSIATLSLWPGGYKSCYQSGVRKLRLSTISSCIFNVDDGFLFCILKSDVCVSLVSSMVKTTVIKQSETGVL